MTGGGWPHWVKVKNPKAPAVTREAEEDWGALTGTWFIVLLVCSLP